MAMTIKVDGVDFTVDLLCHNDAPPECTIIRTYIDAPACGHGVRNEDAPAQTAWLAAHGRSGSSANLTICSLTRA
jgi:hypothetical protein